MKSYDDLSRELARLLQQAEQTRAKERAAVIVEIKVKMAEYGLTVDDLLHQKRTNPPPSV